MKRDSIFYKLFQQSPTLLFELLPNTPTTAENYRFDSVSVKEPTFAMDGVFLPPTDSSDPVYFAEFQFQKDKYFYERLFSEVLLYFYRNRPRFSDWQVVVIYPSRSTEQNDIYPYRGLLSLEQVHIVCLDELGNIRQLPIWVGLMVLTTVKTSQTVDEAKFLIRRSQTEASGSETRAIIEMIVAIVSYKFETASRQEVEAMLDITFQETRVYREIRDEAQEEGRKEGRKEGQVNLVIRQLKKRLGGLPDSDRPKIESLSGEDIELLSEALLDFEQLEDLRNWLASSANEQ